MRNSYILNEVKFKKQQKETYGLVRFKSKKKPLTTCDIVNKFISKYNKYCENVRNNVSDINTKNMLTQTYNSFSESIKQLINQIVKVEL